MRQVFLALLFAGLLLGCGGSDDGSTTRRDAGRTTAPTEPAQLRTAQDGAHAVAAALRLSDEIGSNVGIATGFAGFGNRSTSATVRIPRTASPDESQVDALFSRR